MQKIDRKEFVQGVAAPGVATAAEANFIDKSILAKWYGNQPGGSLHDVYVVEIEGVFEG